MSKTLCYIVCAKLLMFFLCVSAKAQEFRWPREKAFEVASGMSGNGFYVEGGYVRYFQPRKIQDLPFKGRYKSLVGQKKLVAFPCKRKPTNKIPPGASAKVSLFYEMGSGKGIQYCVIGVNAYFHYLLFSRKYLYISAKGGVSVSDNRLLKSVLNDANKPDYYDRIKYGVVGGFEVERMLNKLKSTSLIGGWEEYYLVKSDSWGEDRWYAYIGLRFKI
jgi:hypothetical protein